MQTQTQTHTKTLTHTQKLSQTHTHTHTQTQTHFTQHNHQLVLITGMKPNQQNTTGKVVIEQGGADRADVAYGSGCSR